MKTPRELLLGKHRDTAPKLDELRERFLRELVTLAQGHAGAPRHAVAKDQGFGWREFLLMMRWHLAGLAAMWVAIAVLSISAGGSNTPTIAHRTLLSPRAIILTLKENRRQISEFGGLPNDSVKDLLPAVPQSRRGQIWTDWAYS